MSLAPDKKSMARPATEEEYATLWELFRPHIESFDYFLDKGLDKMLESIRPMEITDPNSNKFLRNILHASASRVMYSPPTRESRLGIPLYPQESKLCHLRNADPHKLVFHGEEATEMGGYFICGGMERLIRILILQKCNYVRQTWFFHGALNSYELGRGSFVNRGAGYTDKAVVIRCVQGDQSSVTLKLYYLQNGSARLGFWLGGREFLLPVGIVLKALIDTSDREIFTSLACCYSSKYKNGEEKGVVSTQLICERAQRQYFRSVMEGFEKDDYETVAKAVLKDYIFVHLKYNHDKFNLLIFMLQKLYALVDKTAAPDNADALQYQEALLPGHLITVFLKDRLQDWLRKTKRLILEEAAKNKTNEIRKFLGKNTTSVGRAIESMLKVGKVNSQSGLDLPQRDGMTIQAERLNFHRYISHFRAVHRGAAFAKMRTTSVRKLLPEYGSFMPFYFCFFACILLPMSLVCGSFVNRGAGYTDEAVVIRCVQGDQSSVTIKLYYLQNGSARLGFWLGGREFLLPVGIVLKVESILHSLSAKYHNPSYFCGIFILFSCWYLQDRLQDWLRKTKRLILEEAAKNKSFDLHDANEIRKFLGKNTTSVGRAIESMLKVGKVNSQSGLDLPQILLNFQRDGMTIQAERLNFHRYISHFRAVHRGAAFAKMRTTSVRKLLPEYGSFMPFYFLFLCLHLLIPEDLEVGYVPLSLGGAYPGLYLFTNPARFVRPVRNLISLPDGKQNIELIGPFEQAFMEIKCPDGGAGGRNELFPATHEEIHPTAILSVVANLTPWSDHNQSPRNMYQCQMAKQTMGFCGQALKFRTDVKAFHLQTECIDLSTKSRDNVPEAFAKSALSRETNTIDSDGLPRLAEEVHPNEHYYSVYNSLTGAIRPVRLKGTEPAFIDYVAVNGAGSKYTMQKANIRLRRVRNPIIGDKFSSRHGQKGVCSQLWPDIDMPFSANTGMRPDLIINPHAFPSRMTIAMLLESMAAKAGSLHGKFINATPFANAVKEEGSEPTSVVNELGPMLASYGFNYHGTEVLYSGLLGNEMSCEIFIGPVYYQRLRHMVSDKFQVRTTGHVDQITRQPIGGRKRGGGIRFGEMERDALLAHGSAYLLHDRLHSCSDYHIADVCSLCGSLLTATVIKSDPQKKAKREMLGLPTARNPQKNFACQACKTSKGMETVAMPYVFRYLAAELAAMNIKLELRLSNRSELHANKES
ncbi:hypothetical protein PR202_ga04564 [Eleusine coracana subsp. coracana]|uniref:DNA-directed RNA polymerase subunit beta n=1 Tax=Eleusine coracana subsp. coracana TaxID=191504 RepID=A0AAV5BSA9_ELECO|nr:hypothetical protein PR202_ga04564 [Eleusine coracana subsp. coracana]